MSALPAGAPLLPRGDERVLVFCGDPGVTARGPSGCSAHLRAVVGALVRRGHEVRLAVHREVDGRGAVDEAIEAPIRTSPLRHWGWLPRSLRDRGETWDNRALLAHALSDFQPDLIWERSSLLCDAGARLAIPRLLEVNAPLWLERTDVHRPARARRIEEDSLRHADRVITVSPWLRDWALGTGCDPQRVRVVPNASSLPPGDRQRGRAELRLEGLVLGFVGSMKPWHGLEQIGALLDLLPQATALLIGEGPVRLHHPRARHLPYRSGQALADAIAAMDVGLAPYPATAPPWFCPLKILDYRSQGVFVLATALGGIPALVGEGGRCLSPQAPMRDWAAAILEGGRPAPLQRTWDTVVADALGPAPASPR